MAQPFNGPWIFAAVGTGVHVTPDAALQFLSTGYLALAADTSGAKFAGTGASDTDNTGGADGALLCKLIPAGGITGNRFVVYTAASVTVAWNGALVYFTGAVDTVALTGSVSNHVAAGTAYCMYDAYGNMDTTHVLVDTARTT